MTYKKKLLLVPTYIFICVGFVSPVPIAHAGKHCHETAYTLLSHILPSVLLKATCANLQVGQQVRRVALDQNVEHLILKPLRRPEYRHVQALLNRQRTPSTFNCVMYSYTPYSGVLGDEPEARPACVRLFMCAFYNMTETAHRGRVSSCS